MAQSDRPDELRPAAAVVPPAQPVPLPSLAFLVDQAADEIETQERRADALDAKAGVLLGFSGVLVGLSIDKLHGPLGHVATGVTVFAGLLAAAAFMPRSYPTLGLRRLRDVYLTADHDYTRLRILDTRIAMYQRNQPRLNRKAQLVRASTVGLGAAVLLTLVASTLK